MHTPGPWEVERDGGNPYIIDSSKLQRIADIYSTCKQNEIKSNARLIAAAPDLLEALEFLYNETSGKPRIDMINIGRTMAKNAIDKAKGAK